VKVSVAMVVVANTMVAGALFAMVAGRKLRRDRRERWHQAYRAALRRELLTGSPRLDARLLAMESRPRRLVDLASVLQHGDVPIPVARAAAVRTGLDDVVRARLRARRPMDRGIAALVVGHLRLDGAATDLAPLLDDPDGDVKLVAAGALGRLAHGPAARALVGALAAGKLPTERVIERLGGPWATPAILAAFTAAGPEQALLRASLARAIGLAGDVRAEPALLGLLVAETVDERAAAARALATCGTPRCHASLIDAMGDPAWEVRAQAARSLGALRVTSAVQVLEANLGHNAWWVRANVARSLAQLGEAGVLALRRAAGGTDRYAAERAREMLLLHDSSDRAPVPA
jgi:HEAT repeat protein